MAVCNLCQAPLQNDEIAIYKKLINRKADTFLCKQCLSKMICCDPELIDEKIRQFREAGCFLFPSNGSDQAT